MISFLDAMWLLPFGHMVRFENSIEALHQQVVQQADRAISLALGEEVRGASQAATVLTKVAAELRQAQSAGKTAVAVHGRPTPSAFERDTLMAESAVTVSPRAKNLSDASNWLRAASHLLRPAGVERRFVRYSESDMTRFLRKLALGFDVYLNEHQPGVRTPLSDAEFIEFRRWAARRDSAILESQDFPSLRHRIVGTPSEVVGAWLQIDDLAYRRVYVFQGRPSVFQRDLARAKIRLLRRFELRDRAAAARMSFQQLTDHLAPLALQQVLEPADRDPDLRHYAPEEIAAGMNETSLAFARTWIDAHERLTRPR